MNRSTNQPVRIAITTGDVDGIGTEVAARALAKVKPKPGVLYFFWRSPRCPKTHLHWLDRSFKRKTVGSWPEALKVQPESHRVLIDIASNLPPPIWVETVAQASCFGHLDGIVTGPLSKTSIIESGLKDMGHTGILKRVSRSKELFMGFIGKKFNVLLATGHIPIDEISTTLTPARLERAIRAADHLRAILDKKSSIRPMALLGLNPHAGEDGLIGETEVKVHKPTLEAVRELGIQIQGPLVPDAAYFSTNWRKYSVFVANYHDQGLIPFKMIHGQESGIQITMGLPFVRTSVDHGTAKDLFGRNKADASSMTMAIESALRLCRSSANLAYE